MNDSGIVVVESDPGRIIRIDREGKRSVLGNISPGSKAASQAQPPSMVFNGITQAKDGNYYLAVETSRVLVKLEI